MVRLFCDANIHAHVETPAHNFPGGKFSGADADTDADTHMETQLYVTVPSVRLKRS